MSAVGGGKAVCMYCGGDIKLKHQRVFHTFNPSHGPFDIYECSSCGSCQTEPPPTRESLAALYGSYRDGLPDLHRNITADDPQNALYSMCVNRVRQYTRRSAAEKFTWLDVGAGGGEFSSLMAEAFPNSTGIAADLHSRPDSIRAESVDWQQVDINGDEFATALSPADVVVSIAVWEHVLRPDLFARNLLRLVKPGGMLYLLCPNNGSAASRVLGRQWPYFTPGEHLSIPTPAGGKVCLAREWQQINPGEAVDIRTRAILMPYTLRYILRRLGLDVIGRVLPIGMSLPVPAGALDAVVIRAPAAR